MIGHLDESAIEHIDMATTFCILFIQMTAAVLLSLHDTLLKWLSWPCKLSGGLSLAWVTWPGVPTLADHSSTVGLVLPDLGYLIVSCTGYCRNGYPCLSVLASLQLPYLGSVTESTLLSLNTPYTNLEPSGDHHMALLSSNTSSSLTQSGIPLYTTPSTPVVVNWASSPSAVALWETYFISISSMIICNSTCSVYCCCNQHMLLHFLLEPMWHISGIDLCHFPLSKKMLSKWPIMILKSYHCFGLQCNEFWWLWDTLIYPHEDIWTKRWPPPNLLTLLLYQQIFSVRRKLVR